MIKKTLLLGLASLLLTSCNMGEKPSTIVNEQAQKRWDALISGNLQSAYQYYSDSFKKTVPYEHFSHKVKGVGLWNKATVQKVTCNKEGSSCEAEIKVTVAMRMRGIEKPVETSNTLKEKWQKGSGFSNWRYVSK